MQKKVFQILVDNTSGVLSRISGLFSRRGYNIESITAGVTADPRYTRITIVTSGDDIILDQIEKQVSKLEDVLYITDLASCESVCRMLMLFKVKVQPEQRESLMAVTDIFHGHIVDVTRDSMITEMTGKREKLNAFIDVLDDYEILEVSSSGMIGLERGAETARKPGVNCRLKE